MDKGLQPTGNPKAGTGTASTGHRTPLAERLRPTALAVAIEADRVGGERLQEHPDVR